MSYSFPCIKAPSNACNTRRKLHMKTVKLVCSAPMYHEQYEVITNKQEGENNNMSRSQIITLTSSVLLPALYPGAKTKLRLSAITFPWHIPVRVLKNLLHCYFLGLVLYFFQDPWRLLSYAFSLIEEGWRNGVSEVVWQEE